MTFTVLDNNHTDYNLSRFASNNNYIINGAFTKLLKYFIINYEHDEIITFADLSWSIGNLYELNNFTEVGLVKPDYKYCTKYNSELLHKGGFRKNLIKSKFPQVYSDNKTESEMMSELGFIKVWNSGLIKYKYKGEI